MNANESHSCVSFDHVSYEYDQTPVLQDISFEIKDGEYIGIIGPNGGGKTTLIRLLLGLIKPSKGTIDIRAGHGALGYVPQRVAQESVAFPATVREIVTSGRAVRRGMLRRFTSEDKRAVEDAMKATDVHDLAERRIGELSGGERQRVFIARALAGAPHILVLDEPYVGIDSASQEKFYATIERLNKQEGITIIFVSHDIDMVFETADHCLCLNHRLIVHGKPKDIMNDAVFSKLYGSGKNLHFHGH